MKRQIRRNVFETNSSSVHSLTMCSESDYDKWVNGELVFKRYGRGKGLVPITEEIKSSMNDDKREYLTCEQFDNYEYMEYETFYETHTTSSGEKVIAFGYYGHD